MTSPSAAGRWVRKQASYEAALCHGRANRLCWAACCYRNPVVTPTIFAAILLAALLHALWNALAKRQAEGRVSVLLVSLCSGLFAAPLLPLVGWPVA